MTELKIRFSGEKLICPSTTTLFIATEKVFHRSVMMRTKNAALTPKFIGHIYQNKSHHKFNESNQWLSVENITLKFSNKIPDVQP